MSYEKCKSCGKKYATGSVIGLTDNRPLCPHCKRFRKFLSDWNDDSRKGYAKGLEDGRKAAAEEILVRRLEGFER